MLVVTHIKYLFIILVPLPVGKLSVGITESTAVKIEWTSPVDTAAVHNYKVCVQLDVSLALLCEHSA